MQWVPALHVAPERLDRGQCLATERARGFALVHLLVLEQRAPMGVGLAAEAARQRVGAGRNGRPAAETRHPGGCGASSACNTPADWTQLGLRPAGIQPDSDQPD